MKNVIRIVIALVFLALALLFAVPMSVGIVNIGNAVGLVGSVAVILGSLFFDKLCRLVSALWENTAGKIALTVCGGVLGIGILTAVVISVIMIAAMNDKPKGETTLVVLGCQVRGEDPSLMLSCRLRTAYDYLSEHEDVRVVVSGGKGDDEDISEALCMYNYLTGHGIAPERIYMEDRSTNTEENLRFSRELIEREGLCGDITIVTDGFHQLRADMLAKKQGMDARNIPSSTPCYLLPTYWVREWFGVLYYGIFG